MQPNSTPSWAYWHPIPSYFISAYIKVSRSLWTQQLSKPKYWHPSMGVTHPDVISKRCRRIHPTISLLRPAGRTSLRKLPISEDFEMSTNTRRKARLSPAPLTPPNSDLNESSDGEEFSSVVEHDGVPSMQIFHVIPRYNPSTHNGNNYLASLHCNKLEQAESSSSASDSDIGSDCVRDDGSPLTSPESRPDETRSIRRGFGKFNGDEEDWLLANGRRC
ncbi:hypothetical protein V1525DRAFT_389426 [Lipomyces kononenkoae]|uniref:Uncharacterized protein n=1 Tax=Lipomyces kononenkoae TaxID=34357 RepID=A0ACC3SXX6_LIPKO